MNSLLARFDALTRRERILVAVAVSALVIFASNLGNTQLERRQLRLAAEQQEIANERLLVDASIQVFQQALGKDPDRDRREVISRLTDKEAALEQEIQSLSANLVSREQLPRLMQDVLQEIDGVKLLGVDTLPAVPLKTSGQMKGSAATPDSADAAPGESVTLYRHAVQIRFSCSYAGLRRYVAALEALPWRLYWEALEYVVADYPTGQAALEVFTLSTATGLFGGD
jgi:MSHA biogenesis protein MshJ